MSAWGSRRLLLPESTVPGPHSDIFVKRQTGTLLPDKLAIRHNYSIFTSRPSLMIHRVKLLFFYCLLSFTAFGTGNDSLAKGDARDEVEKLLQHAEDIKGSDPKAALNSAEEALDLAKKNNDSLAIIHAYIGAGKVCNYLGNHQKALDYLLKAVEMSERSAYKKELGLAYNETGGVFYNEGDYERAGKYFAKALEVRLYLDDKEDIAGSLNNVGETYRLKGDKRTALEYYNRALAINTELGKKRWLSINCANIGYIYLDDKNFPKALEFFTKQYDNAEGGGDKKDLASPLNNLGRYYLETGDPKKALDYFGRGMSSAENVFATNDMIDALKGLSDAYALSGDHRSAYEFLCRYILKKEELQNNEKEKQLLELELPFEKTLQEKRILDMESEGRSNSITLASRLHLIYALIAGLALLGAATAYLIYLQRKKN